MIASDSEARHWPVLLASFVVFSLTIGSAGSMGIFYEEWYCEFPKSSALIGWLSSSMTAMVFGFSLVAAALTKYFGVCAVVVTGAGLSFAALFIASFARELYILFVTVPLMAGCGLGMCSTGAVVIISNCFQKHFALANGIVWTGASIGFTAFPIAFSSLIDLYGWRGAMLVFSALEANIFVCVGLMRAAPGSRIRATPNTDRGRDGNNYDSNGCPRGVMNYRKISDNMDESDGGACSSTDQADRESSENDKRRIGGYERIPGADNASEEEQLTKRRKWSRNLMTFLDHSGLSLFWTNRAFTSFAIVVVILSSINGITLTFFAAQAESVGVPAPKAASLISIIGMSSIASRLTHGHLVDAQIVQPAYLLAFFVALTTVGAPVIGGVEGYAGFVTGAILIGLSAGAFLPLQSVLIRMIVGQDRFPGGYGIALVLVAAGHMTWASTAGFLHDVTRSYSWGFYLEAALSGLSAALVFGLHLLWTRLVPDDRWPRIPSTS